MNYSALILLIASLVSVQAKDLPDLWERAFGDRGQEVWDRAKLDGVVTASEIIEESYKGGSHHDGDRELATAFALIGLDDDPLPALRQMMAEKIPERRAFAAITAGLIGDWRFQADLQKLQNDKAILGQFPGDWHWDTVGNAALSALNNLKKDSLAELLEQKKITTGPWLQKPPK